MMETRCGLRLLTKTGVSSAKSLLRHMAPETADYRH
jgi:hypothetical protein